jgi:hypothetical protein
MDFAAFLATLSERHRAMALALAAGHKAQDVAGHGSRTLERRTSGLLSQADDVCHLGPIFYLTEPP